MTENLIGMRRWGIPSLEEERKWAEKALVEKGFEGFRVATGLD